jgi:tetraacyldisaccharide 4'-kinase
MRRLLWPLNPVYATAVAAKNAAYDCEWTKPKRLQWPVISIGNISVGGSGKTPFVIALAKLLMQHGMRVDVLSRGYGRSSDVIEQVDPSGDVERFGDEPLLIAQSAGAPVYVGADRYEAGLLAEREGNGPRIHLLDDGFQHRRLARDLDIVLVHRGDFSERLLPAGNLREPIASLRRASLVVLREEDVDLEAQLRKSGIEAPIWRIRRVMHVPPDAGKVVAFGGIARPDEFFSSLRANEVEVAATQPFPDHYCYSDEDMSQLMELAKSTKASSFLTTEKDFVRLSPELKNCLNMVVPLKVAKLEIVFLEESAVLQEIQSRISHPLLNTEH